MNSAFDGANCFTQPRVYDIACMFNGASSCNQCPLDMWLHQINLLVPLALMDISYYDIDNRLNFFIKDQPWCDDVLMHQNRYGSRINKKH